jgi:glycosyltransferase involved in cell wall biosynthesis
MLRQKARSAAFIVMISRFLRDNYLAPHIDPGDLSKVHIVRCGIDLDRFSRAPRSRSTTPRILSVARLDEVKGIEYLIDACAQLRDAETQFVCRIIGDGPMREELQARIERLDLADYVELAGAGTQDEVRDALAGASVFVLPSIVTEGQNFEGVPVSLMEAMASGVPVVSTRTGAIGELVIDGETGLLVEQRNADELACAIRRLLEDGEFRSRLVESATQHLRTEFRIDGNAAKLDQLISQSTTVARTLQLSAAVK